MFEEVLEDVELAVLHGAVGVDDHLLHVGMLGAPGAVQCSAVQCSAVQCSAVQRSAAQRSAAQRSAAQRSATLRESGGWERSPWDGLDHSHDGVQDPGNLQCS